MEIENSPAGILSDDDAVAMIQANRSGDNSEDLDQAAPDAEVEDEIEEAEAEEVDAVSFAVFDADSSQAGMFEANQTAFAELKGVLYVRTRWKAGSAAGIYTLRLTVTTTTGRTAETRVVGYVTDLQE